MSNRLTDYILNGVQYTATIFETNELLRSVELILAIACSLFILIPKIIGVIKKTSNWFNKAKEDGKITKEEIDALIKEVEPTVEEIKDGVKDIINKVDENK